VTTSTFCGHRLAAPALRKLVGFDAMAASADTSWKRLMVPPMHAT
jgi:hypothetical protein